MKAGERSPSLRATRRQALGMAVGAVAAPPLAAMAAQAMPAAAEAIPAPPQPLPVAADPVAPAAEGDVAALYLESVAMIERLHRRQLDVIRDEFDRRVRKDVSAVEALLLYNIGDAELTAGELRTRGYYFRSSVHRSLGKLLKNGYLTSQRSKLDRRSVRIALTPKGREVRDVVSALFAKHIRTIRQVGGVNAEDFRTLNLSLARVERFWTDQIRFRL